MPTSAEEDAFMRELMGNLDAFLPSAASTSTKPPPDAPVVSIAIENAPRALAPADSFEFGGSDMDWDAFDAWEKDQLAKAFPPTPAPRPTPELAHQDCTRCVVDRVVENGHEKVVYATQSHGDEALVITLRDDWTLTRVVPGDIVNVIGTLSTTTPRAIAVSSQHNMLVLHPDLLLTATAVSSSHRCARKPALGMLMPGVGPDAAPAVAWGNMLHAVVQRCLADRDFSQSSIDKRIEDALDGASADLVRIGMGKDAARDELQRRAAGVAAFARRFVADAPRPDAHVSELGTASAAADRLAITAVNAVEEDVWSPRYGLKGKVDASVQTAVVPADAPADEQPQEWTQPLEIKTGLKLGGLEHRAQTMLYALLMEERYGLETPSGLLYYTQSDELVRVQARRNELRGLMIGRNEMAAFMAARWHKDGQKQERENAPFLPPPIDDAYACAKCFNVDSCMLFRRAVEKNPVDPSAEVYDVWHARTKHLTDAQCAFFAHWERLIALEEAEMTRFRRELWTMSAREREARGRAFADLTLASLPSSDTQTLAPTEMLGRHLYVFSRAEGRLGTTSLLDGHIVRGDAVTVSVEPDLVAFARGFVVELSADQVTVACDQPLALDGRLFARRGGGRSVFRLDKDELAGGIARIRDNLAQLFYVGGDERRRRLVVDLEPPRFAATPETDADNEDTALNDSQRAAVRKVLAAQDYALVLGMPGTGKTATTAAIVRRLVARGKTVLLTSYTHSAVDTILRALGDVEFGVLRLGSVEKVHPDVRKYTLAEGEQTREQYEAQLMRPPVVATTCLSIDHAVFSRRRFDVCVVDEASQITLPTCLGPLRRADSFVLVGDHCQLAPLVRSGRARKDGLDVSLFRRLCEAHPAAVAELVMQYRMNADIVALSNELVYDGRMRCGSEEVARRGLKVRDDVRCGCTGAEACWIETVVRESSNVLFLDTDALPAPETHVADVIYNDTETQLVAQICDALVRRGVAEVDIGVMSLYRQQIKKLQSALSARPGVEVLTVDRSQGRDKPCIVLSMVRSNSERDVGELLRDWRRVNVALTRAKHKLVVVGARATLEKVEILRKFFDLCAGRGWILALPKDAHVLHDPPKATTGTGVKRSAEGKENVAPRKKSKIITESILKSRPLLRDVVNGL